MGGRDDEIVAARSASRAKAAFDRKLERATRVEFDLVAEPAKATRLLSSWKPSARRPEHLKCQIELGPSSVPERRHRAPPRAANGLYCEAFFWARLDGPILRRLGLGGLRQPDRDLLA